MEAEQQRVVGFPQAVERCPRQRRAPEIERAPEVGGQQLAEPLFGAGDARQVDARQRQQATRRGGTRCTAWPAAIANEVRSTSCRRAISSSAPPSAATSSGPRQRSASPRL
jgi:hypothetical protein